MSTFPSDLLKRAPTLVLLTETVPDVYVTTMTTVISNHYDYLEETLNHLDYLKIKDHLRKNFSEYCSAILVNAERLESAGSY